MKEQKKLLLARNIFVFITFVLLGVIIVTEKSKGLLIPKVEKEISKYIETNYKDIKDNLIQKETIYEKGIYKTKVISKDNQHLYFYVIKKEKKIQDTYQEDFIKGKTLFTYLEKKLEKDIKEKTHTTTTIKMISTFDQHVSTIQDRILKEENLLQLKFYTIEKEILMIDWTAPEITNKIIEIMKLYDSNNITPKSYTLTITNKSHIKESIQIKNLTTNFIENSSNIQIIDDIINNNKSQLLKENQITYKYLNEEE